MPFETTQEQLVEFFKGLKMTPILVKLLMDQRTQEPNGRAIVEFASLSESGKAKVNTDGKELNGRNLKVLYAKQRDAKAADWGGKKEIFLQYLPYDVTEEQITEFFKEAGNILTVRLARGPDGLCKGIGWMTMGSEDEANGVVAWSGCNLGGRNIVISIAQPKA